LKFGPKTKNHMTFETLAHRSFNASSPKASRRRNNAPIIETLAHS